MRNIFLRKLHIKCDGESSPRSFSTTPKMSVSLDPKAEYL